VTNAEAAAIRAAYDYCGELSAAVARECARIIAGWKPLLKRPLRQRKAAPGA